MAVLPALWLGGCADTMSAGEPIRRITRLVQNQTLTESEKNAAITELKQDKERQEEKLEQGDGGPNTN